MSDEIHQGEIDPTILNMVRSRRTVYDFEPEKPEETLLREAIEAAMWAPNHKHTHPWRFYLLGDKARDSIATCYRELVLEKRGPETAEFKAARWDRIPGWFVVTSPLSDNEMREREDYGACCCMIQNLALLLWSAGIGLKWSTGPVTQHESFFEITGIDPKKERVVGLFGYGFPAETPGATRPLASDFIKTVD